MKNNIYIVSSILFGGFLILVLAGMRIGDAFSIVFLCGTVVFIIWLIFMIMEQISLFFNKLFGKGNNTQNQPSITPSPSYIPPVQPLFPKSAPNPYIPSQSNWMSHVCTKESSQDGDTISIYDPSGKPLKLGAKNEKGSGGEGTVYELPVNSKFLVKIYKEATLRDIKKMTELRKRIEDMVSLGIPAKTSFLAWPIMPAMNDKKEIIGFVMRKCSGTSFLALRGPRSILQHFKNWTRYELAQLALDYVKKVRLLCYII